MEIGVNTSMRIREFQQLELDQAPWEWRQLGKNARELFAQLGYPEYSKTIPITVSVQVGRELRALGLYKEYMRLREFRNWQWKTRGS